MHFESFQSSSSDLKDKNYFRKVRFKRSPFIWALFQYQKNPPYKEIWLNLASVPFNCITADFTIMCDMNGRVFLIPSMSKFWCQLGTLDVIVNSDNMSFQLGFQVKTAVAMAVTRWAFTVVTTSFGRLLTKRISSSSKYSCTEVRIPSQSYRVPLVGCWRTLPEDLSVLGGVHQEIREVNGAPRNAPEIFEDQHYWFGWKS